MTNERLAEYLEEFSKEDALPTVCACNVRHEEYTFGFMKNKCIVLDCGIEGPHIYVRPDHRGKGYARKAIKLYWLYFRDKDMCHWSGHFAEKAKDIYLEF